MPSLEFQGKSQVYAHHLTVPFRPLIPDAAKSVDRTDVYGGGQSDDSAPADGENLIIHGDNLHALKALLPTYAGRVKCIYTDPPYNTGNEGWVYNDRTNSAMMREWLKKNQPVDGEDLERHDKWLCMMWPRLQLLKELLAEDGAIFVSIDDNEQHHLRAMMDEVFGERNFVETLVWKKKGGAGNTEKYIGDIVENVVVYARNKPLLHTNRRVIANASYPNSDEGGSFRLQALVKTDEGAYQRDTMKFGVPVPDSQGDKAYPPAGKRWTVGKATMMQLLDGGQLWFDKDGDSWRVRRKDYYDENDPTTGVYLNLLLQHGSLNSAKSELVTIGFRREEFETPKPTALIKSIVSMVAAGDAIVLDSFAGSGTTAQAVLELNREDGGNRKFILVECEDYADTITAERVRRVIQGVPDARDEALREGLGGGFTYCTLGESITVEGMLSGESLPAFDQLAAHLIHQATGEPVNPADLLSPGRPTFDAETSFVMESERQRFHLYYTPDTEWLNGAEGALTARRADAISEHARAKDKKAVVFGPVRYVDAGDLRRLGITFCQLPYELSAGRAHD